jgi:hypothetical protein
MALQTLEVLMEQEPTEDEIYVDDDIDKGLAIEKLELAMFLAFRKTNYYHSPHRVRMLILVEPIQSVKEKKT